MVEIRSAARLCAGQHKVRLQSGDEIMTAVYQAHNVQMLSHLIPIRERPTQKPVRSLTLERL